MHELYLFFIPHIQSFPNNPSALSRRNAPMVGAPCRGATRLGKLGWQRH